MPTLRIFAQIVKTVQHQIHCNLHLSPGQIRAEASVHPGTERHEGPAWPMYIKYLGTVPNALVKIRHAH